MPLQRLVRLLLVGVWLISGAALAMPQASYWAFWDQSKDSNSATIDHGGLDFILSTYVVANHPSGINRFRYGDVTSQDKRKLKDYIDRTAKIDPRAYSRDEQKIYWLNLYNALTINLVLDHYPVASIKDISAKTGPSGPWDEPLVKVAGKKLSLNDIEHRILRPIWKDHKVHFGLVGASLGCPNLQPAAFTVANSRVLLKKVGSDFVNHRRGLLLENGQLQASSIFDWYEQDFAGDKKTLLKVFAHYAEDRKALYLLGFTGEIKYNYDWAINSP